MKNQIICFSCDEVFTGNSTDWVDPDGNEHQLFPMMCEKCRERGKVTKATERPRTPVRLPFKD